MEICGLPQPPSQFINEFIDSYNVGNPIVEVMVEYEEIYIDPIGNICSLNFDDCRIDYKPKVDKNNCITIAKAEDFWIKESL
jgi:hypothetical protein